MPQVLLTLSAEGQTLMKPSSAYRFVIETWGVSVAIEWEEPSLCEPLHAFLGGLWQSCEREEVEASYRYTRDHNGNLILSSPDGETLSLSKADPGSSLEVHLQLYLATHTRLAAYVHAGVVGWKGGALVIPGRSYTGKSTLVHALVEAGATYFSDEYAIIDLQGMVHPYPRRLSLRGEAGEVTRLNPIAAGWQVGHNPLPLGAVISSHFEAKAIWQPKAITRGEAVLRMLSNTVSAQLAPEICLNALSRAMQVGESVESPRGPAQQAAQQILSYFGGRSDGLPAPK